MMLQRGYERVPSGITYYVGTACHVKSFSLFDAHEPGSPVLHGYVAMHYLVSNPSNESHRPRCHRGG